MFSPKSEKVVVLTEEKLIMFYHSLEDKNTSSNKYIERTCSSSRSSIMKVINVTYGNRMSMLLSKVKSKTFIKLL